MTRLRVILLAVVLVAGLVLCGLWLKRGELAVALMSKIYERAMGADPIKALPDGLSVGLCGSGSPMPDPTRAGPCTVVVAGRQVFVVDSGTGSTKNLSLMNLPPAAVSAVFLTHFHSDHIADLGELLLQHAHGVGLEPGLELHVADGVQHARHKARVLIQQPGG